MRAPRPIVAFGCLLAAGLLVAACGGGSDSTTGAAGGVGAAVESRPAPPKGSFPAPAGRTLEEVLKSAEPTELIVSPTAQVFYKGPNRYPFGIFEKAKGKGGGAGTPIEDAEVAIYYSRIPPVKQGAKSREGNKGLAGKNQKAALEEPAIGPFPARIESLSPAPEFESGSTRDDPNVDRVVYSTELNLPAEGEWRPAALIKVGNQIVSSVLPSINAGEFTKIPRVGQKPPQIHTPTAQDVDGDLAKITTRVPPDTLNKVDFAEVLGKEPIVLLFATPQFCQSRVCGPVVDVAEEAQEKFGKQADFIHMEIYNENDPSMHPRPQVRQFHLPSEPWLFTINRDGRVSAAVEGSFGPELLDRAVEKAVSE